MWANNDPDNPIGPVRKVRVDINEPWHAHELTFSCHLRSPLLNRDRTRQWFVEALDVARRRQNFELWSYVVMPEHVHVLLFPLSRDYDMSKILASIKLPVSRRAIQWLRQNSPQFLEKLRVDWPGGRSEYRFWSQGGGYDRNITELETASNVVKYFHDNPVRRGLVQRTIDWPWSSARWYAGLDDIRLSMDARPH